MMRLLFGVALSLALTFPCLGQAAGDAPGLPKDPRELLKAAEPFYDFSNPSLKPWHLKASYQLYDLKGEPTEQGTFEYWWASPQVYRSTWKRASASRTDWHTADGRLLRQESGGQIGYFERTLFDTVSSPLPQISLVNSGRMELGLKQVPAGAVKMKCVVGSLRLFMNGRLESHASGAPEYFCFDPVSLAVRMTSINSIVTGYNNVVKTQGLYIAKQVDATRAKQRMFSITVETIDGVSPSDPGLIPTAEASRVDGTVYQDQAGVDGTHGSLVHKVQPMYPAAAKADREQGEVLLGAEIGTDGAVRNLEVLAAPSSRLANAAVDAVKQWHYSPYIQDGVPAEVNTIVHVIFSLGY
jgi:TonB family protein